MHEKRFEGNIERLRAPERVARLEVDRVVDTCLEEGQSGSLLDVGTGTGLFAEAFTKRGLTVSGLDVSPEMLEAAREYVPEAEFREGLAESLPYPDKSFDYCFLGLVLHESENPLKALKEAHRVVQKEVWILEWPYREDAFNPPLAHRLDPKDLAILFRKAGFPKWKAVELTNTVLYQLKC